ncbi:AAA family ATPase [Thiothrix lacustris]|uniref:AAA family ATPase n=1 Tax=Thiothrix lacustris TaxID=525917 RepID=UPI0027E4868C|nr:MoxR family ATPase [Thiothrix lacustris]WMP17930.1 MoxR family ATPase [Thiothrix lacustris]
MPEFPQLNDFIPANLTVSNPGRKLHHVFEAGDCHALWAAYASGRPLLVRGKPGTGKSQMARAIAEQLGWAFVSEVIQGSTELSDLHWHFDAVGRLGEAQTRAMEASSNATACTTQTRLDPVNFLSPGAFWWAYDWDTAQKQYGQCSTRLRPEPEKPDAATAKGKQWQADTGGVVLLLDEIDKAEPDLPNGLLETLGHYQFTVPYINHKDRETTIQNPVKAAPSQLLIVITTNEERELPKAFVRRCFVHTLKMEDSAEMVKDVAINKDIEKRHRWLIERGRLHFGERIGKEAYLRAAELLWQDRDANPHSLYPPGLAEYIDLLGALQGLDKSGQRERLEKIARYALKKEVDE